MGKRPWSVFQQPWRRFSSRAHGNRTDRCVWDKYNKKELAPTEETARYFLKVSSALESMQDKGYKTDGFIDRRHNIAKNYFVATKIADQLDKNQVSPDFALEVAKVYSLGRGWEFPRDAAKADMWLRVAAKDKSLESEIKAVKEIIHVAMR